MSFAILDADPEQFIFSYYCRNLENEKSIEVFRVLTRNPKLEPEIQAKIDGYVDKYFDRDQVRSYVYDESK